MSLKVLLADDNITAQRLGTKILADAGYEVIAVSNGAAAVKKIASEKPDLLILDVYMPGYTGLEVCDKVKKDPASANVPVILTATNMEPYNQADGHRVGADGFMVKPFEASDLVAVVQKLAAKVAKAHSEDTVGQRTVKMAAVEDFSDASYEEWKTEAEEPPAHKVEVPQEMASAPAFMDEFAPPAAAAAPEPVPGFGVDAPAIPVEEHAAPAFAVEMNAAPHADAPAFAIESAPIHIEEQVAPFVEQSPAADATAAHLNFLHPQAAPETAPATEVAHAVETELSSAPPAEFEPTAVAHQEVSVAPPNELETTIIPSPEVSVTTDPGLVTNADEISQFATGFGVAHAEEIPVGVAMPELTSEPEAHQDTQKIEPYVEAAPEPAPVAEAEPAHEAPHVEVESEMQRAFAVSSRSGAAAAPAPEPAPPANAPIPAELVAQFAAELEQAHQEREAAPAAEAASLEQSMSTPVAPAAEVDEEKIVAAVDRVLERFKDSVRGEMVAAIIRELKS